MPEITPDAKVEDGTVMGNMRCEGMNDLLYF